MPKTHIKLRTWREEFGNGIKLTVFAGLEGQILQNAGSLHLTIGEWQLLGATIHHGHETMGAKNHLTLDIDDVLTHD